MNAPMAQPDPLAALRGIHLPDAVSLWPLAPGWWIALAFGVGAVVAGIVVVRKRRASLAHHALAALEELDPSREDFQSLATSVSALLRRVALRRFGRDRVASLHGPAWQEFLSETSPHGRRGRASFDEDMGRMLSTAPYAPPGSASFDLQGTRVSSAGVLAAARDWIRWNT